MPAFVSIWLFSCDGDVDILLCFVFCIVISVTVLQQVEQQLIISVIKIITVTVLVFIISVIPQELKWLLIMRCSDAKGSDGEVKRMHWCQNEDETKHKGVSVSLLLQTPGPFNVFILLNSLICLHGVLD